MHLQRRTKKPDLLALLRKKPMKNALNLKKMIFFAQKPTL
jgi:hypothetical protein